MRSIFQRIDPRNRSASTLHLIYEQKWTVKDIDYFVEQAPRFPFVNTLVIDPSDLETVSRADSLATIIQALPSLREFRIEGCTNPDVVDALLKGLVGPHSSCTRPYTAPKPSNAALGYGPIPTFPGGVCCRALSLLADSAAKFPEALDLGLERIAGSKLEARYGGFESRECRADVGTGPA